MARAASITQFLDELIEFVEPDEKTTRLFRDRLRDEVAALYPPSMATWEFLNEIGMASNGLLTRTGVLLFGKNPSIACPSAIVLCSQYHGVDRTAERSTLTLAGTIPDQVVVARQFVADRVVSPHTWGSAKGSSSDDIYGYPLIAVREIIANAIAHRDYSALDSCTHVRLYDDRLEVSSPGNWLGRDLAEGKRYALSELAGQSRKRNFSLVRALSWLRLVEGEGSGIPVAISDCRRASSLPPTVLQKDGFVTVTLGDGTVGARR